MGPGPTADARAEGCYDDAVREESFDLGDVTSSCLVAGDGPLVLVQHGFPDAREGHVPLAERLVAAGYRVVLPALRGYAPSSVARSGRHDALAAGDDLVALARRLGDGKPVRLVGHDWGAVATFAAVTAAPTLFAHAVTMSVPHPSALVRALGPAQLRRSAYIGGFQFPGLAEAWLARDDLALVDRMWRAWSPGFEPPAALMAAIKAGLRDRIGPALAYYRALRSPARLREARRVFGPIDVPTTHLHGARDSCIHPRCADSAERWFRRGYALEVIEGVGHFLVAERPDVIAERVLAAFARG